jgi:hypothetical protein
VTASTQRLREVLVEARSLGISLGLEAEDTARSIGSALGRVLEALRDRATAGAVADALSLLAVGHALDTPIELWATQNAVAGVWRQGSADDRQRLAPLMSALGFAPGALAAPHQH